MKKAFTLIELLVVVSIIGVLAVALVPTIGSAPAKARDAARKTKVGEVIKAVEMYNIDQAGYPDAAVCVLDGSTVDDSFTAYISSFELAGDPEVAPCNDGIKFTPLDDGYWIHVGVENTSSATHCMDGAVPSECAGEDMDADNNVVPAQEPTVYAVKR